MTKAKTLLGDQEAMDFLNRLEAERGIPSGTLYKIMSIESGGKPGQIGPDTRSGNAKGYFQFTDATAKAFGVEDPHDFKQAATGAAKYIATNLKRFNGDLALSLVEYNGGGDAVTAYKAGKPFAESANYLKKFGDIGGAKPYTTSADVMPTDKTQADPNGQRAQDVAQTTHDISRSNESLSDYASRKVDDIGEAVVANSPLWAYLVSRNGADPAGTKYRIGDELDKQLSDQLPNMTEGEIQYIYGNATSDDHARYLAGVATLERERHQRLARDGAAATLGTEMVGSILDPVGFAIGAATGGVSALAKGGRAAKIAIGAAEGAGVNLAVDKLLEGSNPNAAKGDAAMSIGMGALFGAGGAALARHMEAPHLKPEVTRTVDHINEIHTTVDNLPKAGEAPREVPATPEVKQPAAPVVAPEPEYVPPPKTLVERVDKPVTPTEPVKAPKVDAAKSFDENGNLRLPDNLPADVQSHINYIKANTENPVIREVLERVEQTAKDRNIHLAIVKKADKHNMLEAGDMGAYMGVRPWNAAEDGKMHGMVQIRAQEGKVRAKGRDELTFTHEMVHSVTSENIASYLKNPKAAPTQIADAMERLQSLHTFLKGEMKSRKMDSLKLQGDDDFMTKYAMSDLHEFVSVGLTDGNFQSWLKAHTVPGEESAWGKFTNAIRRMLGMDESRKDALSELLDISDNLMVNHEWRGVQMEGGLHKMKDTLLDDLEHAPGDEEGVPKLDQVDFSEKDGARTFTGSKVTKVNTRFSAEGRLGNSNNPIVRWFSEKMLNAHAMYEDRTKIRAKSGVEIRGNANAASDAKILRNFESAFDEYAKDMSTSIKDKEAYDAFNADIHAVLIGLKQPSQVHAAAEKYAKFLREHYEYGVDLANNPGLLTGEKLRGLTQKHYEPPEEINIGEKVLSMFKGAGDEHQMKVGALALELRNATPETHTKADLKKLIKDSGLVTTDREQKAMAQELYDDIARNEIAKKDKGKTLTDPLEKRPDYFPRKWDELKLAERTEEFKLWVKEALRRGNEHLDDEKLDTVAKAFHEKVIDSKVHGNFDVAMQMASGDLTYLKDSLLAKGMSYGDVYDIIHPMEGSKAGAKAGAGSSNSSLKRRASLDETTKVTIEGRDYTIQDFVNTDTVGVTQQYFSRLHGDATLAAQLGIYSDADIAKMFKDMSDKVDGKTYTKTMLANDKKLIQEVLDDIRGINAETWTVSQGVANILKNYIFSTMGGVMFLNTMAEMARVYGTLGWKAVRDLPEIVRILRESRAGRMVDEDLQAIENVFGATDKALLERIKMSDFNSFRKGMGDTPLARRLDKMEEVSKKMSNFTGNWGFSQMLALQKTAVYKAIVNNWRDRVMTGKKMGDLFSETRMREWGLEENMFHDINVNLAKFSKKAEGKAGRAWSTDYAAWEKAAPESYSAFMTAMHRQGTRIVLEGDISSQHMFLGKAMGGLLGQFRMFTLNSYDQALMNAAHHRDVTAFKLFLWGAIGNSMMYIAQTHLRAAGREDAEKYREDRLTAANIVKVGFFRTAELSLPAIINDAVNPIFKSSADLGRTTVQSKGGVSQAIFGIPATSLADTFVGTLDTLKGLSDGKSLNQNKVRAWLNLLPAASVLPAIPVANTLSRLAPMQP